VAVLLDVGLRRMLGVVVSMMRVSSRRVGVMRRGFVVAGFMVPGGFRMMVSRARVMLGRLLVVFSSFVRHGGLSFQA